MVLLDTSLIIDIWKTPSSEAVKVFEDEEVCICGVVRSELMHGAYSDKNMLEISAKLDYLEEYNINSDQWGRFGEFLYKLRKKGITLPYSDALIAFIAISNDLKVYSRDKHFKLIQSVEPLLKLYEA